ncbi:hypothetical protein HYU13_05900 [Candidatus Woesearchaeota archaeon]|nr:hypothetical protein [Candidatus Woesearchaeota archaeon]
MERCPEDDATIKEITKGIEDRVEFENKIVAYCANPANLHAGTELPAQVGQRYQGHVHGVTKHFDDLKEGQTGRVFNMGHEPCLTMLVMQVTRKPYDADLFGGAARTAEAVQFRMEQSKSGVIAVRMNYRDMSANYTLR